jgi:hypothetical protein
VENKNVTDWSADGKFILYSGRRPSFLPPHFDDNGDVVAGVLPESVAHHSPPCCFYPLLIGLSHFVGFDETGGVGHAAVHATVAYGVALACSAIMLGILAVIGRGMGVGEITGKVALQSGPAALGALLAEAHFGSGPNKERRRRRASFPPDSPTGA